MRLTSLACSVVVASAAAACSSDEGGYGGHGAEVESPTSEASSGVLDPGSGSSSSSAGSSSSSSTTMVGECEGVVVGDFVIEQPSDAAMLENVGRIEGSVSITNFQGNSLDGLFPCLREVEGVLIVATSDNLVDLSGLESLRTVQLALNLIGNPSLESVSGLHALETTGALGVHGNGRLTTLELPALREVGRLELGICSPTLSDAEKLSNSVESLGGLPILDSLRELTISGQRDLADIPSLRRVFEARGFSGDVRVQHNRSLLASDIHVLERSTLAGGGTFIACNNGTTGDVEVCNCGSGGS